MTSLATKIKLYAEANSKVADFSPTGNVEVSDDGSGVYIKEWNAKDKVKPTNEQLDALESDATKIGNNNNIRATRRNLYGDIGDQLDEIFKDIDAWKTRIQKIKTDNPKE